MNPRDFLNVAEEWVTGLSEAEWRSAVSRAYYGAFHVARALLRACGFEVPQADRSHAYLWLRLNNCGHPDLQNAGEALNDLRGRRNEADYELHHSLDQHKAMGNVSSARDIIRLLDMAGTLPHVLTAITDSIRSYERDVLREVT